MPLLPPREWRVAETIAAIGYTNPFLPERVELERRALGDRYVEVGPLIRARPGTRVAELFANMPALRERAGGLVETMRERLTAGRPATREELEVYEDLSLYLLYSRYMGALFDLLVTPVATHAGQASPVSFWKEFLAEFQRLFALPGRELPSRHDPATVFAGFYQIERAFTNIYHYLIGGSAPAARLRAAVWQSIFTRDLKRYTRVLHRRMADIPTLIVGPSGSGKELVARAIGRSGFVPFHAGTRKFDSGPGELYVPLNLAALAPSLIESELFGHVKGAFTTATSDREGWLRKCSPHGAVFLDEIGELDGAIQIKLLRVLETRRFQSVGSTETVAFAGKIIAATNRDLAAEMQAGRFRHDLYYRLCADQIITPSLAEQLADRPDELAELVRFVVQEILVTAPNDLQRDPSGYAESEARRADDVERLTREAVAWVEHGLGCAYPWPGNFRELGQCVRNVMIRGSYLPPPRSGEVAGERGAVPAFLQEVRAVGLTTDELLGRYYALAYHDSGGSYQAAGHRLGVDWRVVKRRLDASFLKELEND